MVYDVYSINIVKTWDNYQNLLDTFSCSKDLNVEKFLKEKAISFQDRNRSRTWLVFEEGNFTKILGFFSTGMTVLEISDKVSKTNIKSKDGFRKDTDLIACHLVGQLAKNDSYENKIGAELLAFAEDYIGIAMDNVAGRNIIVDVKNSPSLIKFYEDSGYSIINGSLDINSDILRVVKTS